jgi:dihydrofolate reductase
MRKLIVCNLMSLDGYVAGEGGDVMVLPLDESFSAYNVTRLREADTLLLGATTYRGFLSYWPEVEHDTGQPDVEREISSINNRIAKVVVSDSLTPSDTGVWRDTTEIVPRADAQRRVAELENDEGGDILTFGSAKLWNDLLVAGLVSELHLMVGAGAIGTGEPAFLRPFGGQAHDGSLTLTGVRQLEGSQNALLTYAVN